MKSRLLLRSIGLPALLALLCLVGCAAGTAPSGTGDTTGTRAPAGTAAAQDTTAAQDAAAAADPTTAPARRGGGLQQAVAVVQHYYAAIDRGRYEEAYHDWANGGAASGQSLAAFKHGFSKTVSVRVAVGAPGRVEGAAGSRYVEIPVTVTARTSGGERQRFTGSYTLRRVVVDGASAAQRRWHLSSATLTQAG